MFHSQAVVVQNVITFSQTSKSWSLFSLKVLALHSIKHSLLFDVSMSLIIFCLCLTECNAYNSYIDCIALRNPRMYPVIKLLLKYTSRGPNNIILHPLFTNTEYSRYQFSINLYSSLLFSNINSILAKLVHKLRCLEFKFRLFLKEWDFDDIVILDVETLIIKRQQHVVYPTYFCSNNYLKIFSLSTWIKGGLPYSYNPQTIQPHRLNNASSWQSERKTNLFWKATRTKLIC